MKYRFTAAETLRIQTTLRPAYTVNTKWGSLGTSGLCTLKPHYSWNGCTPKRTLFGWITLGTPDGPPGPGNVPIMFRATAMHDWCHQFGKELAVAGISRKDTDAAFAVLATEDGAPQWVTSTYYHVLRRCWWLDKYFTFTAS